MSETTLRSDIRTRVRDYLYEDTADWFTNDQLNRLISEEIRSLPGKDIYLEQVHETNLVDGQKDYTLPSNTVEVERLEQNAGTVADPVWTEFAGWDVFNNTLYLDFDPDSTDQIRAFLRCEFTVPTGDINELDVPDNLCEVVVWGVVVRAYKMCIGYFRNARNWDSVTKPDRLNIGTIQQWLVEAKRDYLDLIKQYSTMPRPRDINLVS